MSTYIFSFKESIGGTPLVSDVYIDGVLASTGVTSLSISTSGSDLNTTIKIIPQNANYTFWENLLFLPDLVYPGQILSHDIHFVINTETIPFVPNDFIKIVLKKTIDAEVKCTSVVEFINNVAQIGLSNICWTFGDNTDKQCGDVVFHTYAKPGQYAVIKTSIFCLDNGIPIYGCCGLISPGLDCSEYTCESSVLINSFMPSAGFYIECNDTQAANNIAGTEKCINGNTGCTCEDKAYCRCISLNQDIYLVPQLVLNSTSCSEFPIIEYYVNDIRIDGVDIPLIDGLNYQTEIKLSFDAKGKYTIKQVITNCCGTCTYEQTITIGGSVEFERVECYKFKVNDFYNYDSIGEKTLILRVKDHLKNTLKEWTYSNYSANSDIYFDLPNDGVFICSYSIVDSLGVEIFSKSYVVYEFCGLFKCYESLILKSINVEACENTKDLNSDINKFVLLYNSLYASLDIQIGNTYGNLEYEDKYLNVISNNQFLLNSLNKLCGKCGIESNSNSNFYTNTTNCSSCK